MADPFATTQEPIGGWPPGRKVRVHPPRPVMVLRDGTWHEAVLTWWTQNGYGVWHGQVEYYVGERHWHHLMPESRLRPRSGD